MKLSSFFATLVAVLLPTSILCGQVINDSMGFKWDIQQNGTISDGSSDTYDGAYNLYVNSNVFSGGQMTQEDGLYSYGPQDIGGVTVSRHLMLTEDPVGMVFVDNYQNKGKAGVNVTPMHHSDMGETAVPTHLQTKKGDFIASVYSQNNGRSAVTIIFGEKNTKYLPKMAVSGDELTVNYPGFKLAGGQERAIAYFVAQRPSGSGSELRDDPKAFGKALRQVARKKKFNFLNVSGMGLFNLGDIELIAQGEADYLVTRGGDQVYGTLVTEEFTLETALGSRKLPVANVVNIIGAADGRSFQVVTSDGGALSGKLTPSSIDFGLSDGGTGKIELLDVSRLVPRLTKVIDPEKKEKWFEFAKPLFLYKNGDRIAGDLLSDTIEIHMPVGKLEIPIEKIKSIEITRSDDGSERGRFVTADGQQFGGMFYKELQVRVWDDQEISIPPADLASIFLEANQMDALGSDPPEDQPMLKLKDDEFLFAKVKTEDQPLEFKTAFGVRTIAPEQISSLSYIPGLAGQMKIVLWDGSTLRGKLTAERVIFEILETDMELLPSMITDYSNPTAVPPESMRQKYVELINQLGSPKFKEREDAYQRLERDAEKIKGLLESHIEGADAETKTRLMKLLGRKPEKTKKGGKKGAAKKAAAEGQQEVDAEEDEAEAEAADPAGEEAAGENEAAGEEAAGEEAAGEEAAPAAEPEGAEAAPAGEAAGEEVRLKFEANVVEVPEGGTLIIGGRKIEIKPQANGNNDPFGG